MGTILVLIILAGIVALSVRGMIRDKKAGRSIQCGGDCKFCGGYCHQAASAGTAGKSEGKTSEPSRSTGPARSMDAARGGKDNG